MLLSHNFLTSHNLKTQTLLIPSQSHSLSGSDANAASSFRVPLRSKVRNVGLHGAGGVRAVLSSPVKKSTSVKAVITVLKPVSTPTELSLTETVPDSPSDTDADADAGTLLVELVAAELDANTGEEKPTIQAVASKIGDSETEIQYETTLDVPKDFGVVGAVKLGNENQKEMFVKKISLDGFTSGAINISCDSWVASKSDNPVRRVFFSDKSYLPSQTPSGLEKLRRNELNELRGNGEGERKSFERIYDYDVYNDLGDPDTNEDLARPVLGGPARPYPRRCRTGRPKTKTDPLTESRSATIYVPRDEAFSAIKHDNFQTKTIWATLNGLIPTLRSRIYDDPELPFPSLANIDTLFDEGFRLPNIPSNGPLSNLIPRLVKAVKDINGAIFRFETPEFIDRDRLAWLRDAEFARQTLAGINPCAIQLVTEWPLKSTLDPAVYGPPESAISTELVEQQIGGMMTVEEAVKQKKLFMLDYNDLLLPFVEKVRGIEGRTLYGSRTLFFLMPSGTLRPIAIELTRPKMGDKPQWKRAFDPCWEPTALWLWRLAKTHVLAHDSGYHQLISHWVRTHCAVEPYVIATNRQLSAMHPIYRLLRPHLRYTLEINALARGSLINADGVIENGFSPGKYSMELSSVAYDLLWRFDLQALPADLISRGMAVEDPSAPHGLKLTIEDYPYANDGLLVWDAIKDWVTDYVPHYYNDANMVQSDVELQAWWTEIRTVGHGDKKDEAWWPGLNTTDDLIHILTTIIWTASGHHAAVNFGQFDYGAYFPNRPTIARSQMPVEEPSADEKEKFMERPEAFLLDSFPSQYQAASVMTILDVLSTHSPDEEYIADELQPYWEGDKQITAAFERFKGRMVEIEGIIDSRNIDTELKNRTGAGVVPYELLKPYSGPGVTGKGVPNSISI